MWSLQVDNGVVVLEHVDLFDVLEGLHAELLDLGLEFLVLVDFVVMDNFLGSSLGSYVKLKSEFEHQIGDETTGIKMVSPSIFKCLIFTAK